MFRRKDEAYNTQDLLHDVMSGIEDDELLETTPSKLNPANTNIAAADSNANDMTSINTQKGASTMETNDNSATNLSAAATPAAQASTPAAVANAAKPATAAAFRPQAMQAPAAMAGASRASLPATTSSSSLSSASSKRVLTVGHDIHMKGEISTCDRLVIDGSVDASLSDVHTVEISQTGAFKGTAEIEDAEISGSFEGDLIVNGRLTIYASGRVSGNVAYGEIEIERGGKLTGSIKTAEEVKSLQNQAPRKAA